MTTIASLTEADLPAFAVLWRRWAVFPKELYVAQSHHPEAGAFYAGLGHAPAGEKIVFRTTLFPG